MAKRAVARGDPGSDSRSMVLPAPWPSILVTGCRNTVDPPMVSRSNPLCLTATADSTLDDAFEAAHVSAGQSLPPRPD